MVLAVFDQDALTEGLKRVWDKLAPPAMFTAAGNIAEAGNENFLEALDMVKWNKKSQQAFGESHGGDYGYSGTSEIIANTVPGSNNSPDIDVETGTIKGWRESKSKIRVPAGFSPIRGNNVRYAD